MHGSEHHPRPQPTTCQPQIGNFHIRFQPVVCPATSEMQNFLGHEEGTLYPQTATYDALHSSGDIAHAALRLTAFPRVSFKGWILLANSKSLSFSTLIFGKA